MTFRKLHEEYVGAVTDPYTYSYFLAKLHADFPEISKARQTEFSQCSLCNAVQALLAGRSLSPQQLALDSLHHHHREHVQHERQLGATREVYAGQHPEEVISFVIDTMSKRSSMFPSMRGRPTAAVAQLQRAEAMVTLSRVHGSPAAQDEGRDYFYVNNGAFPKNASYIASVLLDSLLREAQRRLEKVCVPAVSPYPRPVRVLSLIHI